MGVPIYNIKDVMKKYNNIIFVKDKNSNYVDANEKFLDYFGIKNLDELRGKSDYDLSIASFSKKYVDDDQSAMLHGEIQVIEPALRYDGRLSIMLTHKYSFIDSYTNISGIMAIAKTIETKNIKNLISLTKRKEYDQSNISTHLFKDIVNKHAKFPLTSRELDVLYHILHGFCQKQIAHKLNLSVRTVEDYMGNIKYKLNCLNKAQLFEFAIHYGLMNVVPQQLLN